MLISAHLDKAEPRRSDAHIFSFIVLNIRSSERGKARSFPTSSNAMDMIFCGPLAARINLQAAFDFATPSTLAAGCDFPDILLQRSPLSQTSARNSQPYGQPVYAAPYHHITIKPKTA